MAAHGGAVHAFHGAAIGRGHLQQVGHALDVFGAVMACRMEERGIEEDRIALGQRQLDVVLVEIVLELGLAPGEVARHEILRIGQIERGAAFNRHVAMGDGALQREYRRKLVGMGREALDLGGGLEAHVIVAVHGLRLAAGVDHIELRGDLVAGAEPAFGNEGDDFVGIVFGESFGIAQAKFFQGVPDAVIGAGLGEMIAAAGVGLVLFGDHGVEGAGGRINDGLVGEGILEHEMPGPE